jgi:uncharacterized repeat protein (TIGR01451 family)
MLLAGRIGSGLGRIASRRITLGATGASIAAVLALFAVAAFGFLEGSPSRFEAGDGNMTVDTSGNTDWNCFTNFAGIKVGQSEGQTCGVSGHFNSGKAVAIEDPNANTTKDNSWKSGQKLDTECPALIESKNPVKDTFTNVASYNETNLENGHTYLYGATIRFAANGNANENVELNQRAGTNECAILRTAGDKLIGIDYVSGGTKVEFRVLTWITSTTGPNSTVGENNGTCFVSKDAPPCWGAHALSLEESAAEGKSNQSEISAENNGISKQPLVAGQFAEFGVDLTKAKVLPSGVCETFPQTVWESRSSGSSFESNPEDIEIAHHRINNCGEIRIIKQSNPRGVNHAFGFSSNMAPKTAVVAEACAGGSAGVASDGSFSLNDSGNAGKTLRSANCADNSAGNTVDETALQPNTYTITEGTEPEGFVFGGVECEGGTTSTPAGKQQAIVTLHSEDLVNCVFVNNEQSTTTRTHPQQGGSAISSITLGQSVTDHAEVSAGAGAPTGTVEFFLCSPTQLTNGVCSSGGTPVGSPVSLSRVDSTNSSAADSASATPTATGTWCWRAVYNPASGTGFIGSSDGSSTECFEVTKAPTSTKTTPGSGGSIVLGGSITDTANLSGALGDGFPAPTGTVTFFVCGPGVSECTSGGSKVGEVKTLSGGSAGSDSFTPTQTGRYCFRAVYSGDGNYQGSSDGSSTECFTVIGLPNLAITKTADTGGTPSEVAAAGNPIGFTITVTSNGESAAMNVSMNDPLPNGSGISWSIDSQSGGGSCSISGTAPSQTLSCSKATMAVGESFSVHVTSPTTVSSAGTYNNTATASATEVPPVQASAKITVYGPCTLGYPSGSAPAPSSVTFSESEVLRAASALKPNGEADAVAGPSDRIALWYNDEHALTLGVRQVSVKTSTATTTTNYAITPLPSNPGSATAPSVGTTGLGNNEFFPNTTGHNPQGFPNEQAGTDTATWNGTYFYLDSGRPVWPALFISDITTNTSNRSGDWQQGGTLALPPTEIFGTWKGATRTVDKTHSPWAITVTPEADPATHNNWSLGPGSDTPPGGFASLKNEGYGGEVRWNVSALSLSPGHAYRLEFMVHDGDQNKSGGDAGEACMNVVTPGL